MAPLRVTLKVFETFVSIRSVVRVHDGVPAE